MTYTKAVDFLQDFFGATEALWKENQLPGIETNIEFALKILKDQEQYNGTPIQ